ncbi:MFS transporter [Oceanobacillus zhaokaii]|uniref:MFS transporter n=2 Tax=Oceanobacillus zhaokaii TaxID=2052660 RepID=A0A345PM65_9BACI|nr:MFS transporter [Oceanobacillus zhaokaii]
MKHPKLLLTTIGLGILLNPLNSSMIAVAISRLQETFDLGFATASWLISAYYLASAITMPVMGKLSDIFGQKKVFLTGMTLVVLSSTMAPFSPTFGWLIVFRLIQAVGSGSIYPAGMAIVRKYFNEGRARALAVITVFSSTAAAFGPSIGGFLLEWGDWSAIFLINFPVIVVGFFLALWMLPKDETSIRGHGGWVKLLDIPGIFTFGAAIVFGLFFLLSIKGTMIWWSGAVALLSIIVFILRERRTEKPFIDLDLFAENHTLTWVHIQYIVVNIIYYSTFFAVPLYLQDLRGFSSRTTGLLMLCIAGWSMVISPLAGRWIERSGSRPPLLFSSLFLMSGSILYVTWDLDTPIWWVTIVLCLVGISNGFNNVGLQNALFENAPVSVIGTAAGLFMTARFFGTILSTLMLGLLFGDQINVGEIESLGFLLAALSVFVLWMSWRLPRQNQP